MSPSKSAFKAKAIPDTTLRRLRNTPNYFFLIWRWTWWLYALIVIIGTFDTLRSNNTPTYSATTTAIVLLTITFLQTLAVTLYAPIFQILLPGLSRRNTPLSRGRQLRNRRPHLLAEDEEADILTPLARTWNPYWDIAIYGVDVLICGLIMYYGGPLGTPPFGDGSPFYRYGFSAVFAAAFAYRYRGGLTAAIGYDLFVLLGIFFPAPGAQSHTANVIDIAGSLLDAPIAAILAAYLTTLTANYAQSKRREQDNGRRQRALLNVGETILREGSDRQRLLQKTAEQLRQGGHFQRLVITLVGTGSEEESEDGVQPEMNTCVEVDIPDTLLLARNPAYVEQVIRSEQKLATFELLQGTDRGFGIARLYLPAFKEGRVHMVIGAESRRQTPFDSKQEGFLSIAGAQLLLALDNIRLTEQTIQLAAAAERGRIAREIHDGIAQLTYMLSLSAETCATQAHRIVEASEEDAELLTPLAQRLDKLVTVSKQALWETRNYMFSLKPLMSGSTTLTQMLTNQVREFETISDLPIQLEIDGDEESPPGQERRRTRKYAQVGTAIFRIVQEALTNAYKHAEATQLRVRLHYLSDNIKVEVSDNGKGLKSAQDSPDGAPNGARIYSGQGMRGMRERAEELGGTFEVAPLPESGVKVQAQIPL